MRRGHHNAKGDLKNASKLTKCFLHFDCIRYDFTTYIITIGHIADQIRKAQVNLCIGFGSHLRPVKMLSN